MGKKSASGEAWLQSSPYRRKEDEPLSARFFAAMTIRDTLVAL